MECDRTVLLPRSLPLPNGKVLVFRHAREADAAACISYLNQVSSESDFLSFGPNQFDLSVDDERALISKLRNSENGIFLIAEVEDSIAGILTFEGGSRPRTRHTGEFGISVAKSFWGLGIGKEMMKILIEWAVTNPIIWKLNLRARTDNERAIHLYSSLGFEQEGIITRDIFIDGKFYDCVLMGLKLKEEI